MPRWTEWDMCNLMGQGWRVFALLFSSCVTPDKCLDLSGLRSPHLQTCDVINTFFRDYCEDYIGSSLHSVWPIVHVHLPSLLSRPPLFRISCHPQRTELIFSQLLNRLERARLWFGGLVTTLSQRESLKSSFSTADSSFNLQVGLTGSPVCKVNFST